MPRARWRYLRARRDVDPSARLPAGLVERRLDHAERDDPAGRERGLPRRARLLSRLRQRRRGSTPTVRTTAPIALLHGQRRRGSLARHLRPVAERSSRGHAASTPRSIPARRHDFDDPGEKRQDIPANAAAKAAAMAKAASAAEGLARQPRGATAPAGSESAPRQLGRCASACGHETQRAVSAQSGSPKMASIGSSLQRGAAPDRCREPSGRSKAPRLRALISWMMP